MKILYCDDTGAKYDQGKCLVLEAHTKKSKYCRIESYDYIAMKTKDYLKLIEKKKLGTTITTNKENL